LPQEESQNGPEIKEEHGILPEDYQTPSINEQPNISNNITKKKKKNLENYMEGSF